LGGEFLDGATGEFLGGPGGELLDGTTPRLGNSVTAHSETPAERASGDLLTVASGREASKQPNLHLHAGTSDPSSDGSHTKLHIPPLGSDPSQAKVSVRRLELQGSLAPKALLAHW